jgi:hypothetical protein
MPEPSIDLNSLLGENPVEPKAPETVPQDQPETAATGSLDEPPELDATPEKTPEPVTLKAYAEKAGIDLKELYKMELSDGTTLSAAADGIKAVGSLQTDRESFEAERISFRTDKAQTVEQLNTLQRAISSGESPEQAAEALKQLNTSELEREQRQLLSVLPEWRDPTVKQADVEQMVAFAGQFGLSEADIGQIRDHRWLAMLRHNSAQAHRLKDILNGAEKPTPKGVKAGKAKKPDKTGGQAVDLEQLIKSVPL